MATMNTFRGWHQFDVLEISPPMMSSIQKTPGATGQLKKMGFKEFIIKK
jgi:hypothetical protein